MSICRQASAPVGEHRMQRNADSTVLSLDWDPLTATAGSDQFWPVSKEELFELSCACMQHQGKIGFHQTTQQNLLKGNLISLYATSGWCHMLCTHIHTWSR